ncbi:MAG TPA: hypothetical protein VMT01_03375 [Candidatus Acidoferrum sp.]|nr:hypothetical protein [Candidatus Acidoferrum sp.]
MSEVSQQLMGNIALVPLLIISVIGFLAAMGLLWRKGKTVEALLVWISLWLYVIAVILLFR